jgi:hypothetical protein
LQPQKVAARLSIVIPAKSQLIVSLMMFLVAGLLCSQICDFNCSFYGCSVATSTKASDAGQESHCHNHQPQPEPEKKSPQDHDQSPTCPGHFDLTALSASPPTLAFSLQASPQSHLPETQPVSAISGSLGYLIKQRARKPDRSPPARSVLRI